MLHTLLIDLNFYFVFLSQILQLTVLVPQLRTLILNLLLRNDPEVVNSLSLVLIEPSQIFLFLDHCIEFSALLPECLLILRIIDIVNCFCGKARLLFDASCFLRVFLSSFLWWHL